MVVPAVHVCNADRDDLHFSAYIYRSHQFVHIKCMVYDKNRRKALKIYNMSRQNVMERVSLIFSCDLIMKKNNRLSVTIFNINVFIF